MTDKMEGVFVPLKRESPAGRQHLHTLTAGAWLPFMQSIITGFIAAMVTLVLTYNLRARSPWLWSGSLGVIAWGLTWLQHQRHWFSLTSLEQATGLDLNRDGVIGEPAQVPEKRIIHIRMEQIGLDKSWHQVDFDLPAAITEAQMEELSIGILLQHQSFAHREWTGKDGPFSDGEFRDLRRELIKREMIRLTSDKDAHQGFHLTLAGRKMLEQFLPDAPSPIGQMD
jgi:hypothetical protein